MAQAAAFNAELEAVQPRTPTSAEVQAMQRQACQPPQLNRRWANPASETALPGGMLSRLPGGRG
jgi:hypothetical protein